MKNSGNIFDFPLSQEKVAQYLPQKPPFVMVGELIVASDELMVSNFVIDDDNMLVENGFFSEAGLVENMAQTALLGALILSNGNTTKGDAWLLTIEQLEIYILPKSGSIIKTQTTSQAYSGFSVVSGKVLLENNEIASCKMKVIHSDTYKNEPIKSKKHGS